MAAWILLAFAAFACFYIGEEFQNGTIRNTLSLGRNRMTYYVSETSRYAFDHNTWRGFDHGTSHACLHTCFRIW